MASLSPISTTNILPSMIVSRQRIQRRRPRTHYQDRIIIPSVYHKDKVQREDFRKWIAVVFSTNTSDISNAQQHQQQTEAAGVSISISTETNGNGHRGSSYDNASSNAIFEDDSFVVDLDFLLLKVNAVRHQMGPLGYTTDVRLSFEAFNLAVNCLPTVAQHGFFDLVGGHPDSFTLDRLAGYLEQMVAPTPSLLH